MKSLGVSKLEYDEHFLFGKSPKYVIGLYEFVFESLGGWMD